VEQGREENANREHRGPNRVEFPFDHREGTIGPSLWYDHPQQCWTAPKWEEQTKGGLGIVDHEGV